MTTRFLQLAHHTETGAVLSDTVFRFVTLKQHMHSVVPEGHAELAVPADCLDNGKIANKKQFISFLRTVRKTHKLETIKLVLASSQIQTFSVSAKGAAALYVKEAVEKTFGLSAKDIAYDYNAVASKDGVTTFHVTAMPKALSQEMVSAFKAAGMTLTTIESVAHALSRDILPPLSRQTALLIDVDAHVTSLIFIAHGKVSHSILLEFGDEVIRKAIAEKLGVTNEEAQRLEREEGLVGTSREVFDVVSDDCNALVSHINDAYIAWRKEHPAVPTIENVYLTGAGSTLKGFDEYISAGLHMPVQEGNVWANCLSFDEHIPALAQYEAIRYGSAIGVALVGGDTVNMLPHEHQQSLKRQHAAHVTGKIVLSFIFGVIVGFAVARIIAIPSIHVKTVSVLHKIRAQW